MTIFSRSLAIVFLLNFLVISLFAQEPTEAESLIIRIQQRLTERQTPAAAKSSGMQINLLRTAVENGKLSTDDLIRLEAVLVRMDALRMRTNPHQVALLAMVAASFSEPASIEGFGPWLRQLELLLQTRDTRPAERFLEQTSEFISKQRLAGRGSTNWFLRQGRASFSFDTTLLLHVRDATLSCATARDSLRIYETTGMLYFISQQWIGQGGKAGWERFHIPLHEAWVEFSDYSIDMTRPLVTASPAIARFPERIGQPVHGAFEDQVYSAPPNDRTPHPRFVSSNSRIELKDVFPGVDFLGAVIMQGQSLIGSGSTESLASLRFRQGNKVIAIARAQRFDLSRQQTQSRRTTISFFYEYDSLYHPGLDFRFDNKRRQLTVVRTAEGRGRAPFSSSYHKLFIASEAMYWNIDEDYVHFRSLDGMNTLSRASVTSHDFFSGSEFRSLKMIDEVHPMYEIERFIQETAAGSEFPINFLATYMRKPPEQVVALVLNLVEKGYMLYDGESNMIRILPTFYSTLAASAAKEDFDVLRLNSETNPRSTNVMLKISDFSLTVIGVGEVVLSEKQGVQLFPEPNQVVFGKNRDFRFRGHVKAGLFDFYARDAVFEYDPFQLQFSFVDSLAFSVLKNDQQAGRKPEYVKVRNVIVDLTGTLRIDEPRNKSGRIKLSEFPSFTSTGESYVYFDQAFIQQGTLKRDKFFYVVDPFRIDSLSNFSTENFRITGYLNSGRMFPVIREQLNVMPDYTLGFTHVLPQEGYPMFDGLARFYTELSLSGDGFKGAGQLHYQTSDIYSKQFRFYPDSVSAITDSWLMQQSLTPVAFPPGKGEMLKFKWTVPDNIAYIKTIKDVAQLYSSSAFLGLLQISPLGLKGQGMLSFEQAVVNSLWFDFKVNSFRADTADFSLMPTQGNKPAFLATDYLVNIDFDLRAGNFIKLVPKSRLAFPFNQYSCTLDEAQWLMDQNQITLNNQRMADRINLNNLSEYDLISINLSGSEFVSEHPNQGGLSFFTLKADYDLTKYAIEARDVKIIRVADVAVFPTDGKVTVLKDAQMLPLESALIIADTVNKLHRIENAWVSISSRSNYQASGNYAYRDTNGNVAIIRFSDIRVNNNGITMASGRIEPSDPLMLNPWFAFNGEVILMASLKTLRFNGAYRTNHNCFEGGASWVKFDTFVDPSNVKLPLRPIMSDMAGNRVHSGLFYSAAQDRYRAFLLQNTGGSETIVSAVSGLIHYDKASLTYKVESNDNRVKDFIELNTNRCIISGQGTLDLGLRLPNVDFATYGGFEYRIIPDSLYLDISMTLRFPIDDKLVNMMADSLSAANLPGANLNQGNFLIAVSKIMSSVDADRLNNEIALYGSPRRLPDALMNTLFFSNIRLKWNPNTRSFVSIGTLSLASMNRTVINKNLNGFVELEQSRVSDGFSIYLMPTSRIWYFFNYRSGLMQLLSSSEVFNTALATIKDEKRIFTDDQGNRYEYTIANRRRMVDFIRKMQEIDF